MADNVASQAVTTAGTVWAADDISSVFYPRCKLVHGADGTNDGDISTANPLPVRMYIGTTIVSVGASVVDSGTIRVTLASNDPLVATTLADDAAFTPATSKVMMAGYTFDDVAPDSVNEGDAGAARMSANRCIYVNIRDNAGNERGLSIDASGALAISTLTTVTTVTTVGAVTAITNALPAGTNAIGKLAENSGVDIGDVDVTSIVPLTGATNLGKAIDTAVGATDTVVGAGVMRDDALTTLTPADGDWTVLRVDSLGQLWVNLGGLTIYTTDAVYAAGTGIVSQLVRDDALTTLTPADGDWAGPGRVDSVGALWTRDRAVLADDAAFTPATSFVVPVGYIADETASDSVDEGDVGAARMTLDRYQRVVAELESSSLRSGGTTRTPVSVVISHASSGDNTLVAALGATLKCRVVSLYLISSGTVSVRLESGAAGTALTGVMPLTAQVAINWPFNPLGWAETAADTLLNLELSGAVGVYGVLKYIPTT